MTGFNLIVIALGAGLGSYLLWTFYHTEISAVLIAWRHQQIRVLQLFTDRFDLADAQMRRSNPAGVTLRHLYGISHAVGRAWRLPGTVLIVALAIACMVRNAPSKFRRQFDFDGLIAEQAAAFTTTAAFVKRQLRLVPPAAGSPRPADYALSPDEWIARNARTSDAVAFPRDGFTLVDRRPGSDWNAPLTIRIPSDTPYRHWIVSVRDWATGKWVATVYLSNGVITTVLLPGGFYRIAMAAGSNWQGEDRLFGVGTMAWEWISAVSLTQKGKPVIGSPMDGTENTAPLSWDAFHTR